MKKFFKHRYEINSTKSFYSNIRLLVLNEIKLIVERSNHPFYFFSFANNCENRRNRFSLHHSSHVKRAIAISQGFFIVYQTKTAIFNYNENKVNDLESRNLRFNCLFHQSNARFSWHQNRS